MTNRLPLANVFEDSTETVARVSQEQRAQSLQTAMLAAKCAAENKGQDIVVLDMTKQTSIFDFFVIVTGTSRRQLHAVADDIARVLREDGDDRASRSGYEESRWIVLDYGGVIVHLFDEETRAFYDLEGLWADSAPVDISEVLKETGATVSRGF